MEWQTIETAPKDGTIVLLWPHLVTARWEFGDEEWLVLNIPVDEDFRIAYNRDDAGIRYCLYANVNGTEPTHWMPLPEPPVSDQ